MDAGRKMLELVNASCQNVKVCHTTGMEITHKQYERLFRIRIETVSSG